MSRLRFIISEAHTGGQIGTPRGVHVRALHTSDARKMRHRGERGDDRAGGVDHRLDEGAW